MMQQGKEQLSTNFTLLSESGFPEDQDTFQGHSSESQEEGAARLQSAAESRTFLCPRTGL